MLSDRCPICPPVLVCLSVTLVYCDQTVGWIKMKFGREVVGMRDISVSEKYRGIKSDGIIYHGLAKYRGIPSGGTGVQYALIMVQIT